MKTCVSLFAGGGLKTIGAMQAGFTPVNAIEVCEDIAACYAANVSPHVTVMRVEDVDPRPYAGIGLLLASPVCTRASIANADRGETGVDQSAADGVCRWLREARPEKFLMENVTQYLDFASCRSILACLTGCGYAWTANSVNFADYGVPQTRRRLIVRARLGKERPPALRPTHRDPALLMGAGQGVLFEDVPDAPPWNGWYDAIADILPGLPESRLADWQLARLPADLTTLLMRGDNTQQEWGKGYSAAEEPSMTLRNYTRPAHSPKAVLVENITTARAATCRAGEEPSHTLTSAQCGRRVGNLPTAILIAGDAAGGGPLTCRTSAEPSFTIKTASGGRVHRAVLVSDQTTDEGTGLVTRDAHQPGVTVLARGGIGSRHSAVLPDSSLPGQCRVVALDARCLARLMTMPDWYELPASRTLASTILGNGVPCLGVQRILEAQD